MTRGLIPRFWLKSISTDRVFVATLYTSDADKIMRYTDEVRVADSAARKSDVISDGVSSRQG